MSAKKGFFIIELMLGLFLFIFFILIITHYIIEVKNIQQSTIARMEMLSLVRTIIEKIVAHPDEAVDNFLPQKKDCTFAIKKQSLLSPISDNAFTMITVSSEWNCNGMKQSIELSCYSSTMVKNNG